MRLVSYNVENLFARPKAMQPGAGTSEERAGVLAAHARLSVLLDRPSYAGDEAEILILLERLGVLGDDEGDFVRLRKLRGQLLRRPRSGPVELVAEGRGDWVGWVELKTVAVDERATENTARVIDDLGADVVTVIEADDRPGLDLFSAAMLLEVGGTPYEQVMVVEGNDDRGIDVGLMARPAYPLRQIRTHVYDTDDEGVIFSRDCCEYHLGTPSGVPLVLLVNHFKSKGFSAPGDPIGARRRLRQAHRVHRIYLDLLAEGFTRVAVTGDLNDDPESTALAPLLDEPTLRDVSEHPDFDWNHRRGTFGSGNERDKIDYVLLSDALFARCVGGGVHRKGVWHGPRTTDPWDLLPTLEREEQAASDHAAIFADLQL